MAPDSSQPSRTGPTFGNAVKLFSGSYMGSTRSTDFDVSPAGKRFLMVRSERTNEAIEVTTSWPALLQARDVEPRR